MLGAILGAPKPFAARDDLVQQNLVALLRACDIVFGSTSIALAALGTWLHLSGRAQRDTAIGLWFIPAFNLTWSVTTRSLARVPADLLRNIISLPAAVFLYVNESGVLARLWFPSLALMVFSCLSLGIGTRRPLLGCVVALAYGAANFFASVVVYRVVDFAGVSVPVGLIVVGLVFSQVAAHLGRSLEDARRQRDSANDQKEKAEAVAELLDVSRREVVVTLDSLRVEIEQRARMELELRQAQKLESVGRLAAGVAHEINTPIQFIKDNVQFVQGATSDVFQLVDQLKHIQRSIVDSSTVAAAKDAAARAAAAADLPYLMTHVPQALASAVDGLNRVATIVRSMKEFAHPDTTEMADADLNRAVENTLTVACNEYKYVATVTSELGELPPVRCRLAELNQALLNLVINAAHAIGDAVTGSDRKGLIHVRTRRDGDDVIVSIADNGCGIPAAARERVFDPFFTTKEVGRGSGQGLAITRSVIVDKHGGTLWFETEDGAGTTFFIRLPIRGPAETTAKRAHVAA